MCYSGTCEFESYDGECRLSLGKGAYEERSKWSKENNFEYCGCGLSEEEFNQRQLWIKNNKDKFKEFKKKFMI